MSASETINLSDAATRFDSAPAGVHSPTPPGKATPAPVRCATSTTAAAAPAASAPVAPVATRPQGGPRRAAGSLKLEALGRGDVTVPAQPAAALPSTVASEGQSAAGGGDADPNAQLLASVQSVVARAASEALEWTAVVDRDFRVEGCTAQYLELLGLQAGQVIGKRCHDYIPNFEATPFFAAVSASLKSGDSTLQIAYSSVLKKHISVRLHPREGGGFIITGAPASPSMLGGHEAVMRGLVDPITNLGNRHALSQHLSETLKTTSVGLGLIEWHDFQAVCDRMTPEVAEMLLLSIVSKVNYSLSNGERLYRLDTALYAVLMPEVDSSEKRCARMAEILRVFSDPSSQVARDRAAVTAYASYADHERVSGVSATGGDPSSAWGDAAAQSLLRRARLTLREARSRAVAGAVVAYSQAYQQRLELERDLCGAIDNEQFALWAQPKVDLFSSRICGAELLVRWNHPVRGTLPPGVFLDSMGDLRMMVDLDNWVIETAGTFLGGLVRARKPLPLAINLSVDTIGNPSFVDRIQATLKRHGVPAHLLEVEIPEGALMADVKVSSQVLTDLHSLGVKVSVDDFGTGYCSYKYLSVFPLDALKIDRSFVATMRSSTRDEALVQSMITLGNALSLRVVAEGAETGDDLRMLVASGCHQVQGYAIAKPMPFTSFLEFRDKPLVCDGLSPFNACA